MGGQIKDSLVSLRNLCIRIFDYMLTEANIDNEKRLAKELIDILIKQKNFTDEQKNKLNALRIAIDKNDRRMIGVVLTDFDTSFGIKPK